MRVALASIHPRSLSGQVEGLVGLAQALEQRGHLVHVVSAFPNHYLLGKDRLQLANTSRRILLDQPARMTRVLAHLIQLAPQVQVIQLNLPTPAFSMFADLLQACVRVPVIVGYEAHLVDARELWQRKYVLHVPGFYLMRLLINNRLVARCAQQRAAHYVVNSQFQKTELIKLGIAPARISTLPSVLPADKLLRSTHPPAQPALPPGRAITYVGHYNHVKGVDVLVRAFHQLSTRLPDTQLVLAWSGIGANRQVEQLMTHRASNGRVHQVGQVRVPDLLAASDVVVLPYRLTIGQAAYPATLLEALAANVPIVTTDLPLLRELTQDGKTAELVPPDDAHALAAAIERVLSEPLRVQAMLQAQRAWVTLIEPARVIKEYEQLYANLAQ